MAKSVFKEKAQHIRNLLNADKRTVAYLPNLARALSKLLHGSGVKEALFLCQLLYWDGKGRRHDGFIYKSEREWTIETGLSEGEQETIRRNLTGLGVVKTKKGGLPCTTLYRLIFSRLEEVIRGSEGEELTDEELTGQERGEDGRFAGQLAQMGPTSRPDSGQQDSPNGDNKTTPLGPRSKTTTKNTQKEPKEYYPADAGVVEQVPPPASGGLWLAMRDPNTREWQCPSCERDLSYKDLKETGICPFCDSKIDLGEGSLPEEVSTKPTDKSSEPDPLALANIVHGMGRHLGRYRCIDEDEAQEVRDALEQDRGLLLELLEWAHGKRKQREFKEAQVVTFALKGFHNRKERDEQGQQGDSGEDHPGLYGGDVQGSIGPDGFGLFDR
jgi:hypothetical protein